MRHLHFPRLAIFLTLCLALLGQAYAADNASKTIRLATTTSTENSGLLTDLLPQFTKDTGYEVHVIAVGTGKALRMGMDGDVDVVLVHARAAEDKFVAEGYGEKRYGVMYNDFVIVGPKSDPAGVKGDPDVADAMKKIAGTKSLFASRGDDSGTHKREKELWKAAGIDQAAASGDWYRETGSGMGATLNVASGSNAYALTDRGTWLSFTNRGDLQLLVSGDKRLRNEYGVTLVSTEKFPHVKAELGQKFIDWLVSKEGQDAINGYKINGEQLFYGLVEKPMN